MAEIVERILCPQHSESTPSCIVYDDGFYKCFGCGAAGKISALGLKLPSKPAAARPPEDLEEGLAYIESLPLKLLRGLLLRADSSGYYLVWPEAKYYLKRRYSADDGQKYLCPKGHKRPLLTLTGSKENLLLVEGELNAFSFQVAMPTTSIASPGSAGDFSSKKLRSSLTYFRQFDKIVIIADDDKAGAEGAINAFQFLSQERLPVVGIWLMGEDANDVLVKYGKQELHRQSMARCS